ncbi:DUF2279 domain-containing protein [Fulvivirga lutimaris]|uniref:DUF2279 domain-containing protein n=1 Tax=Fulvivirga lutimaris TaxID=1819566 RepID=UPI0012BD80C7|nr:DUF2279 domain-containing protein [Fulvivirga lutimaris]MTI39907.1 DUF2279 domain-containing protein [Fulvivirga lutimaris]
MNWNKILLICFLLFNLNLQAQDSTAVNKRLKPLIIGSSIVYTGSLIALDQLWYSDFERESFHFFNDNKEWYQIDKLGHFYSSFHISKVSYHGLKWAGLEEKKSIFWGSMVSVMVMTPIEIFDGFSSEYGASPGDIVANSLGTALFFGQQSIWGEIRIHPKYSFSRTEYPQYRPDVLGANFSEELIKDYNGQHQWLSFDLSKFNNKLPKWLNIAIGYGGKGMVYANEKDNEENGFNPRRQYFIAIDFDFNEYKTRSKIVNTALYFINMIKLPAPTLELSNSKFKFHSFYY